MIDWWFVGTGIFMTIFSAIIMVLLITEYKKKHKDDKFIKDGWIILLFSIFILFLSFYLGFNLLSPQEQTNQDCEKNLNMCIVNKTYCPEGYELINIIQTNVGGYAAKNMNDEGNFCWQRAKNVDDIIAHPNILPIKNYRLKDTCELNPREDADCVCDKYVLDVTTGKAYNCNGKVILVEYDKKNIVTLNPAQDGSIKCIESEIPCIKAHVRTPTERCAYQNGTFKKLIFENRIEEVCEVVI